MTDVRVEISGAGGVCEAAALATLFDIERVIATGIEHYGLRASEEWKAAFTSLCHQNQEGIRTGSVLIEDLVEKADELT